MRECADVAAGLDSHLRDIVRLCARGELPANVALMRLVMAARSTDEVEVALGALAEIQAPAETDRLTRLRQLWIATPSAWTLIKNTIGCVEASAADDDPLDRWTKAFDLAAKNNEQAGAALYALGRPDLMEAATGEVMKALDEWGALPAPRVLEIGCGGGRFIERLAGPDRTAVGIDISLEMLRHARERCRNRPGACLVRTNGRDLACFPDRTFDLALAVDSFPYLVEADLQRMLFTEAARVLRARSALVILNYSYRQDASADYAEVADLGGKSGFELMRSSTGDFTFWDATSYLLRRLQ